MPDTIDTREVKRAIKKLGDSQARAAFSRSLNRSNTTARKVASQEIRQEVTLKAGDVRKAIKLKRATARNLDAETRVSGKPVGLIKFQARQTKRGVSVKVKRSGGRKLIRGAFIATMRSGHRGVFWRRIKGGKRVGRLEIDELFSTTVAQALDNQRRLTRVFLVAQKQMVKELRREIAFRVARKKGAAGG